MLYPYSNPQDVGFLVDSMVFRSKAPPTCQEVFVESNASHMPAYLPWLPRPLCRDKAAEVSPLGQQA